MTKVMQDKATALDDVTQDSTKKLSVAEREFRKQLQSKDDLRCRVLAEVVLNEHLEFLASKEPNRTLAFTRCISAQGDWAIEQLSDNEHHDVPLECNDTRMFLCGLVISGWLNGSDWEVQKRCARTLRNWPTIEAEGVSKLLRKHLESSSGVLDQVHINRILGEFFVGADPSASSNEIWRTVFKAIARYADTQDLVLLGQTFYVLQTKATAPLRDTLKQALTN